MQEHDFDVEKEIQVKADIHSFLEQEEVKWKQRAKENWMKFGDRNTKFFHARENQKNSRHRIDNILDQEGRQCSSQEEIEGTFINYFQSLFKVGDNLEVDTSTSAIQRKVTQAMTLNCWQNSLWKTFAQL
jgi:hypothetical protein